MSCCHIDTVQAVFFIPQNCGQVVLVFISLSPIIWVELGIWLFNYSFFVTIFFRQLLNLLTVTLDQFWGLTWSQRPIVFLVVYLSEAQLIGIIWLECKMAYLLADSPLLPLQHTPHIQRLIFEALTVSSFTHLSEGRRVTFESKSSKFMVSAAWSLISPLRCYIHIFDRPDFKSSALL